MPSGIKEDIVQAARRWAIATLGLNEATGQAKIIPASRSDDPVESVAPAPPYVVVNLETYGQEIGTYETYYRVIPGVSPAPDTYRLIRRSPKRATLRLLCVGEEAEQWATALSMFRDTYEENYGTLARVLNLSDVSYETERGQMQRRHVLDLLLEYRVEADGPEITPAQIVGLTLTPEA